MNKFYVLKSKFNLHKTPIFYTGSSVFKAVAGILVSFTIARYLSPEDLGLWATISLALTYASFLQAGVTNGLNLELPFAYGRKNHDYAEVMASVAQAYTLLITIFIFTIGLCLFFFLRFDDNKVRWGVLAITLMTCFTFYQGYLLSTFRSKNSFKNLAYIQFADAMVNFGTIILIIYYLYCGLLLKSVIVLFVYMSLLHIFRPIRVGLAWDTKTFLHLLKVGLPIFALSYAETLALTFDKLYIIKFSNLKAVGFYSFAYYGYILFLFFSTAIASYIYPQMTYNYAQDGDKLKLWLYVKKVTYLIIIIQTPILIFGYFIIPPAIQMFFPDYLPSIATMQLLLIAGFFKGCVIGVNVLWSIKSWRYMIYYQLLYCILLIALSYFFYKFSGFKIEGIAVGLLVASALNFLSAIYFTRKGTLG